MKKGDIVTVVAISGEYVGAFDSQLDTTITLSSPKMIVSNPDGGMGFAHGVAHQPTTHYRGLNIGSTVEDCRMLHKRQR